MQTGVDSSPLSRGVHTRAEALRCFLKLRSKSMHIPLVVPPQKTGIRNTVVEVPEVTNSFTEALDQLEERIDAFEQHKRWLAVPKSFLLNLSTV